MKLTKNQGITLIALIITVVILLILASVTLSLALSNNGIVSRTKESITDATIAQIQEKVSIWKLSKRVGKKSNSDQSKTFQQLLNELEEEGLINRTQREEIEETGEVTIGDTTTTIIEDSEFEEYDIVPTYVIKITTQEGTTTKYETIEEAIAALKDGDLLQTIGTLTYDKEIAINKNVTISGKFKFTTEEGQISITDKTLTLKDLTVTGNSSMAIRGTNSNSKIYVGENSNVSISSTTGFAVGIDHGRMEIHSGTYKGERPIYCGGSLYGGTFVTNITGSDTHLIGEKYIFRAFSGVELNVGDEVDIQHTDNTGADIIYQGGGAVFNVPESFTIYNQAHGSYTLNGVYHEAY